MLTCGKPSANEVSTHLFKISMNKPAGPESRALPDTCCMVEQCNAVKILTKSRASDDARTCAALAIFSARFKHCSTLAASHSSWVVSCQNRCAHMYTARHWSGFLSSLAE
jgi:hypothetical protein